MINDCWSVMISSHRGDGLCWWFPEL